MTKAEISKLVHQLPSLFQIGKRGITDNLRVSLDQILTAREIVKISILNNSDCTVEMAIQELQSLKAEVVFTRGRVIVLYRRREQ